MALNPPSSPARGTLPWLAGLFFASGAAGLIYQILWLRLLSLAFGVTVYAATAVLAGFMAGLGLGSLAGGWLAPRVSRPLLWFGIAEAGVGVSALATPVTLGSLTTFYAWLHPALAESPGLVTAARFACSFAVLLLPTTLMGASLPLLIRAADAPGVSSGPQVGVLYGANTAGAIGGAVAAGFYLIGAAGIQATFAIAATLNLGVALGAAVLSRRIQGEGGPPTHGAPPPAAPPDTMVRRAVLVAMGVSGVTSLALEVIWFRMLVLLLPATTYAFSTMLAAVLGGIAAGSAAAVPMLRRPRDWPVVLGRLQIGTGVAAIASMLLLAMTYAAGWRTSGTIQASIVAIVPAAFLMGLSFPIAAHIWAAGRSGSSASAAGPVGTLYAINVWGAIGGSMLGGFVLLPLVGSRDSLLAVAGLQVAAGILLLAVASGRRALMRTALPAAAAWLLLAVALPDPFDTALSRRHPDGESVLWKEEGIQNTVSVNRDATGQRVMYLDGLHQANDTPEMIGLHRLIGHLPMVLHPNPSRALVIGLGGGATAGAVARHPVQVDLVELSDSVARGAAWFSHVNDNVLRQDNVRLVVDDGRNHLLLSGRRYDVITADIIQPFHAGAGLLYSADYFALARQALADDGVMLQWIGHGSATQYALIMRTFLSVFPHATAWSDGALLVGSKSPLALARSDLRRKLADPRVRDAVASVGIVDVESVLRLYTAGPDEMRRFVGDGTILTDDRPLVEFHRSMPADDPPVDLAGLRGNVADVLRD
jgi:spermidine synthase